MISTSRCNAFPLFMSKGRPRTFFCISQLHYPSRNFCETLFYLEVTDLFLGIQFGFNRLYAYLEADPVRKRPCENGIVTAAGQSDTYENCTIGEIFRGDFQIHGVTAATRVKSRAAHRTAGLPTRQHHVEILHLPVIGKRIRRI